MPHVFRVQSAESKHLAWTPHGLCMDSAWTGRLPIWHRSPHNRCFQSAQSLHGVQTNALTPQTVLRLVQVEMD